MRVWLLCRLLCLGFVLISWPPPLGASRAGSRGGAGVGCVTGAGDAPPEMPSEVAVQQRVFAFLFIRCYKLFVYNLKYISLTRDQFAFF